MKKIIALSVCIVILSAVALFMYGNFDYKAGKGNGVSRRVESLDEFKVATADVLNSFPTFFTSDEETPSPMSAEKIDDLKKTSATIIIDTYSHDIFDIYVDRNEGGYSNYIDTYTDMTIDGTETWYLTEDGRCLAIGKYQIIEHSSDSGEGKNSTVDMEFEVYVSENDEIFIRYKSLDSSSAISPEFKEKVLGKWLDISSGELESVTAMLIPMIEKNIAWLHLIHDYVNDNPDGFTKEESIYKMKDETFKSFTNDNAALNDSMGFLPPESYDVKGNMAINLEDKKSPVVNLVINESVCDYEIDGVSVHTSSSLVQTVKITNIDNTVIKMGEIDAKTLEEILGIDD